MLGRWKQCFACVPTCLPPFSRAKVPATFHSKSFQVCIKASSRVLETGCLSHELNIKNMALIEERG